MRWPRPSGISDTRIPNDFVVGYGLDIAERYRNIPDVRRYEASDPD